MMRDEQSDTVFAVTPDMLNRLAGLSARRGEVGQMLEALADELPKRQGPIWREARQLCSDVLERHVSIMIDVVLPMLVKRTRGDQDCQEVLARITADYRDEADRMIDLQDLLRDALATDTCRIGSEALGYALRNYFEAIERQTAWEVDVILPLAARKLSAEDRRKIDVYLQTMGVMTAPAH